MSYFMSKLLERQNGVDDLTMMSGNGVEAIVTQLAYRLDRNKIYTSVGDVLIAVNPYRILPIFGPDHVKMYQTAFDSTPHVYGLAERAYRAMKEMNRPQAVIISGESGAGKTESAKLFLHYVSSVSGSSGQSAAMKQIILQSNPLLESFGNAKTVRNNNSSRFGKYLELKFNDNGEPVGGVTSNFLLEKTRVSNQGKGERNFHIFYQLLAHVQQGGMPELLQQAQLQGSEAYAYTMGTTQVDGVDDRADFQEVLAAMNTIHIPADAQWYVMTSLAAILHLGNFTFAKGQDVPARPSQGAEYSLQMAAFLMGVEAQDLFKAITHKTIQMGGRRASVVQVPQNRDQATQIRDALAKETYSRIFDLVVGQLNQVMFSNQGAPGRTIGILDIYGFEIFKENGFEQICINYVNEKLQQIFIELTVRGEQREYHDEGIQWRDIAYFDNKVVCDLIEGSNPPGILRILDDTCKTLHAVDSDTADTKFIEKLQQSSLAGHPHLRVLGSTSVFTAGFTIKHYAGDVTYNVREFAFKNMDNLFHSLVNCLKQSQNPFMRSLWQSDDVSAKAPTTSSTKIRSSCAALVTSLMRCAPHYIRCIKPNEEKRPMFIEEKRVLHQVKYLGLVENVKIKKAGYAYRAPYDIFLQRFHYLAGGRLQGGGINGCKELCNIISKKYPSEVPMSEWCFGRAKLFISSPQTVFLLEEFREEAVDPKGYADKVRQHEAMERAAAAQEAKVAHRGTANKCCVVM
jgi:myosin-1